jgi:hypothetical protein
VSDSEGCPICGAAVIDADLHRRWHEEQSLPTGWLREGEG